MSEHFLRALGKTVLDRRRSSRWRPQDGPQRAFVDAREPDVCFGGARGGGKSVGLLLSFKAHSESHGADARGIVFRRTFTPELEEIIRKGQEILVAEAGWTYNGSRHEFTSPSRATLRCAYLENAEDASRYQGHEYTWMGFDELGSWPEPRAIDLLWGSLRSPAGVPCVRRSTCNPGGPGHVWVRDRYDPDHPGRDDLLLTPIPEHPELTIRARFIASRLEDNPKLLEADPTYEARLASAGSKDLFEAWRYGRWDLIAGQFFDLWNPATMTIDPNDIRIEPWHVRWLSGDWGFADDCVIHWHAQDEDRRVITYRELRFNRTTPDQIAREIVKANLRETLAMFAFSPDAFAQRTSVRTIADEIGEVLRAAGLPWPTPADNDRIGGWTLMRQVLQSGHWRISRNCVELAKSIPLLQRSERHPEDIDDSPVDHAPDSARYGLKTFLRARPTKDALINEYVRSRIQEPTSELPDGVQDLSQDERVVGGRIAKMAGDHVMSMETDEDAAARWTRIARLSRTAEAKVRPRLRVGRRPTWGRGRVR